MRTMNAASRCSRCARPRSRGSICNAGRTRIWVRGRTTGSGARCTHGSARRLDLICPDLWRILAQCRLQSFPFKLMETSVFVGREKIVAAQKGGMARWRKKLFVFLSNNAISATEFFHIPSNLVVELGGQTEI